MRVLSIVIAVVCIAISVEAIAGPKLRIAVAPLQGDPGDKVGDAVAEALAGEDFVVVGPRAVRRAMTKLRVSGRLDARATRSLTTQLEVDAVIDGKVRKAGDKRALRLDVHRRGKPTDGFTVVFTTASSDGFRRKVHDEVRSRLGPGTEDEPDDAEARRPRVAKQDDRPREPGGDDDDDARSARPREADRPRKLADDDRGAPARRDADDGDRKPRRADPRRVAQDDGDDDEPAARRRKRKRGARDETTQLALARVAAGASAAQRFLTFDTRAGFTQVPPRVRTYAGAGRIDGELYPFALASPRSQLAGLGLAATYDRTVGLSIKLPNQPLEAPIRQSHYALGARYRFGVGDGAAITLGLDYARRQYIADRSGLGAVVLDAPDVDYTAIAPGVAGRVPLTPTVAIFGTASGLLMLQAGPIQQAASYGAANVYGIEVLAGVDVAIAPRLGLRIAAEVSRIKFAFDGKGMMSTSRDNDATTQDVTGATDRSIGVAATLGLVY